MTNRDPMTFELATAPAPTLVPDDKPEDFTFTTIPLPGGLHGVGDALAEIFSPAKAEAGPIEDEPVPFSDPPMTEEDLPGWDDDDEQPPAEADAETAARNYADEVYAHRSGRARKLEQFIQYRKQRIERDWRRIGRFLAEYKRDKLWEIGDWASFDEWLIHIDIGRSWAYDLIAIETHVYRDVLQMLSISKARLCLARLGTVTTEAEAVEIAEKIAAQPLWKSARAELYGEESEIRYDIRCPSCNAALIASKAVRLEVKSA